MTFKRRINRKRRKLMKTMKSGLPMLSLVIAAGCEVAEPENDMNPIDMSPTSVFDSNPKGSTYDLGFDMGDEAEAGEAAAGEAAAGEAAAGEAAAGEAAAGEAAAGESAAGESAAGETAAGEATAGTE